jgi:hypothetical protein
MSHPTLLSLVIYSVTDQLMKKIVGIINDIYVSIDENNMTSSDNTSAVG